MTSTVHPLRAQYDSISRRVQPFMYRMMGATMPPRTMPATKCGAVILSIILFQGCATLDAKVAIPVSCIKDAPAVPVTASEAEILAMSEYAGTLTTWTERLELKAYAAKADAIIQACR